MAGLIAGGLVGEEKGKEKEKEKDFHHPYEAYGIQKEFMRAVYRCAEEGKVGILESPTGTGKSLSLICGALTWLRDHKRKVFEEGINTGVDEGDDDEPEWIVKHAREEKRRIALQRRSDQEARLAKIRENEQKARVRYESGEPPHKRQKQGPDPDVERENSFMLEDYQSDDETTTSTIRGRSTEFALSAETQALLDQLGMGTAKGGNEEESEQPDEVKVFYCSRTHSQITQFVNELRRVKLPPAVAPIQVDKGQATENFEELKHLTLGSRKNLCINPKVSKLGNTNAINDRCLELQQPGTAAESRCQYLPRKDNEVLVNDFRDHAMAKIRDIEDFGKLGRKIGICPYYATRAAIRPSEIVTLPYPLLLQKSAREALNISLKNHVVIIDEAHNLLDAIANMHSVSVSLAQLKLARSQLGGYLLKFRNRLKGKNRVYVTQLVRLLDSLMAYLEPKLALASPAEGQAQVGDLMAGKGVDQINLYKLMHYLQESKLARKVERYAVFADEQVVKISTSTANKDKKQNSTASLPVLTHVQSFLLALTYPAAEGRFFFARAGEELPGVDVTLKYQLLDPTFHFKEIVEEARAVILAGGTMSPMSDYTNHLFRYLPHSRIETLSCGHVIPSSNLLAMTVATGPSGVPFDFTFGKRQSDTILQELGNAILQFSRTIPDGFVVFFPSYAYLATAVQSWQKPSPQSSSGGAASRANNTTSLWQLISHEKRIFLEPKSTNNTTASTPAPPSTSTTLSHTTTTTTTGSPIDKLLASYTSHISTGAGALLLAVISGSLSEGINFSDRLGRAVAVVGLPFPNAHSAEWKAMLEFIERRAGNINALVHTDDKNITATATAGANVDVTGVGKQAAREYYENACMRAVNQSVGRAIRHKDDWAAVLLLDGRFEGPRVRGKLPGWIGEGLVVGRGFGGVLEGVGGFVGGMGRG